MYNNLKGKNLVPLRHGGTLQFKPARSWTSENASSKPADLDAIELALKHHEPIYILQHANGTVFDVLTHRSTADTAYEALVSITPNGKLNVRCYERRGSNMLRIH